MKIEELTTSQLYIVGNIMGALSEKLIDTYKEINKQKDNEDIITAMDYVLNIVEEVNRDVAKNILSKIHDGFHRYKDIIEED